MIHSISLLLGDVLQVTSLVALFAGAFASSWYRAVALAVVPLTLWGLLRISTIFVFGENSPPLAGFLVAPVFAAIYVCFLRGLRILFFRLLSKMRRK